MEKFIDAIEQAVKAENWYAAIYLALTMPDICSKLQKPSSKKSAQRYVAWFKKYLDRVNTPTIGGEKVVFLSGRDCYALRCSILHEGSDSIAHQQIRETLQRFYFATLGSHRIMSDGTLTLDVTAFCREMCDAVNAWSKDVAGNKAVQGRIREMLTIRTEGFSPAPGLKIEAHGGLIPAHLLTRRLPGMR